LVLALPERPDLWHVIRMKTMRTLWNYALVLALGLGPYTLVFRGENEPFVLPLWLSVFMTAGTALWLAFKIIEDRQQTRERRRLTSFYGS
jgi:hypothetical protein